MSRFNLISIPVIDNKELEFNTLFKCYFKRMCLYAFQFVHDEGQAEDIVQGCFIKLWEKRATLDFSYDSGAFIYAVVRNACYDHLRNCKTGAGKINSLSGKLDIDGLVECSDEENLRRMILSETLQEIYRISDGLPEKCREIFQLLFIEGREHAEVARALNISESTIRSQKAKAVSFIRAHLGGLLAAGIFFADNLSRFFK